VTPEEALSKDCPCDDPRDEEIKRLKKRLKKKKSKGGTRAPEKWPKGQKQGRGGQLSSVAERYEGSHLVRTSTVTIPANSVMPGVTRNRYRVMATFARIDSGTALTIIRVHASGTDPTKATIPTAFVGVLQGLYNLVSGLAAGQQSLPAPYTWPTPGCCCWKAIYQSDLCLVNTDTVNAQQVSVCEVLDASGDNVE
jgi:hypothetical protein